MAERTHKQRPTSDRTEEVVEEAALAIFRQCRADMLEERLMPPEAIRRAMRDPLFRSELERTCKLIEDYRKSAQKQYRWALGELRKLQRDLDLPSAEIIKFPVKRARTSKRATRQR